MDKAILTIIITALFIGPNIARGHVNSHLLTEGCGSCHVGHGISDQPMLPESEEEFCYSCHGSAEKRSAMVSSGKLSSAAELADIEREFQKSYRHPVEEGTGHSPTERLPVISGSSASHAECVDCHNPHQKIRKGSSIINEVSGYSLTGQYLETCLHEYEICLKCHAEYRGFDRSLNNLNRDFSLEAHSQHPVTKGARGVRQPSISRAMGAGTTMKCSSCHTGDDPDGPRGPHGSNHRYLLSGNYTLDVFSEESLHAYEFCYSCHDRFSILTNESFPFHREHIEGNPANGASGTSCYTCHASHGSRDNRNLIRFNPKAVTGDKKTGLIRYESTVNGRGLCYLTCHGHAHSPGKYGGELK